MSSAVQALHIRSAGLGKRCKVGQLQMCLDRFGRAQMRGAGQCEEGVVDGEDQRAIRRIECDPAVDHDGGLCQDVGLGAGHMGVRYGGMQIDMTLVALHVSRDGTDPSAGGGEVVDPDRCGRIRLGERSLDVAVDQHALPRDAGGRLHRGGLGMQGHVGCFVRHID